MKFIISYYDFSDRQSLGYYSMMLIYNNIAKNAISNDSIFDLNWFRASWEKRNINASNSAEENKEELFHQ